MMTVVLDHYFRVCVVFVGSLLLFFFLMIRRPPRSTQSRSLAASDVYKRQGLHLEGRVPDADSERGVLVANTIDRLERGDALHPVSYTHLRAHETVLDLVCRLLLEKKNNKLLRSHKPHASLHS